MTFCPIVIDSQSGNCQTLPMNDIGVIHLHGRPGGFTVVDADMFDFLNQFRWCIDIGGYPAAHLPLPGNPKVRMHQIVNGTPHKMHTDHRNGFKLDNRRNNLRTCSYRENMMNQRAQTREKYSKFKGVCRAYGGKWMAYIGSKKTRKYLGSTFPTDREAAAAYNKAAIERFGEYALLNDLG